MVAPQHGGGSDFYDHGYDDEEEELNNRVIFSDKNFYGREKEIQTLKKIYRSTCCKSSSTSSIPKNITAARKKGGGGTTTTTSAATTATTTEFKDPSVALIAGYSGAGKSKLVTRFREQLDAELKSEIKKIDNHNNNNNNNDSPPPFFFLSGKYDELQCADPFSAIVEALSGFSASLLQHGDSNLLESVRNEIKDGIGIEACGPLTTVVPDLEYIIGSKNIQSRNESKDNAWNCLKYAFINVIKAICTKDHPVIMFLDDMQWIDSASLDLITTLLTDKSLAHFMFIGAIRSNEMDHDHILHKRLDIIGKTRKIERIDLLNLSMGEIGDFVADTLELQVSDAWELSEAIYSKTRGNIFFAMQSLLELERKNVLYFSLITFQWEWNLKGVDMETTISSTVLDAVADKIMGAPEKLQRALKVAAYTRSTIDINTLQALMDVDGGCPVETSELIKILDIAVLEGLLSNNIGSKNYKFYHDRIQHAAYSLVPSGPVRNELLLNIGKRLYELGTSSSTDSGGQKDWMLFVAADHLNSVVQQQYDDDHHHDETKEGGNSSSSSKSIEKLDTLFIATYNLKVGEKAIQLAAYSPASIYLQKSLNAIQKINNYWDKHYDLSLRLYRAISDVEMSLGNFDKGNILGQQVFNHAKTLTEKLPTYLSLAVAKGRQERHADAVTLCQTALSLLGTYPKRFLPLHVLRENLVVKRLLKNNSDSTILSLPLMKDSNQLATMKFLRECSLRSFHCGNLIDFMFCILRMLRITFQYGLCGQTAQAFASYGVVMGASFNQEGAIRMSKLTKRVLEITKAKDTASLCLATIAHFIDAWTIPHDKVIEIYQVGHKAGMEAGDIECGFRCWQCSNYHAYVAGYPLEPVEQTGADLVEQLQLYNVDSILSMILEIRVPITYLVGSYDHLEAINWEELENIQTNDEDAASDTYRLIHAYLGRLELAIYFRKLDVAERMAALLHTITKHDSAYITLTSRLFFTTLMATAMVKRHSKKQKTYITQARSLTKEMKKCIRLRGFNCVHRYLLMEAELMACAGHHRNDKMNDAYETAITAALKAGATHDAALGSELAGEYFMKKRDAMKVRLHISQASELYKGWGAIAKVRHLERKWSSFIDKSTLLNDASILANWVSEDLSESRKSTVLDWFSTCQTPRTEVPIISQPIDETNKNSTKDRDEGSCLTESSETVGCAGMTMTTTM